jgi:uncharacterized protein (TIGR02444 family)
LTLWNYALATYARPGVEAACLSLQDEHGQCAPLLLWRMWAVSERRPVDAALVEGAAATARAWDEAAVAPLRQVRRRLKHGFSPIPDKARTALREDLKSAELRAERMLLETLEAMTPAPGAAHEAAVDALVATARAWGAPAPIEGLEKLISAAA